MMSGQWIREEIAHQKKDGTVFPVEVFAGKIEIGGRWVVIAIENDISDRRMREQETRELEHQLYQAQKMESIGRLAGGIAHDFDNMLTSIMGYAEFLRMRFTDNTTREGKATETILRNAERAANLTKQLLDFSRRREYHDLIPMDLHGAVKKTVNLTERLFEDKIVVEYDFPEDIPAIEADENQLHQVLTNLIINARDAMPRGGKISFKTGNLVMESGGEIHERPLQPGHYVYLIIADSGEGMSQEVVEKVFEPFFTTKGMNGTGLGLATVYSIMKNHGGHVRCKSAPGLGTTFELFFPTTVQPVSPDKEEPHLAQGQGEILLIEGNDDIRGLMHQQLSILGYQLDSVKTGEEGLELLKGKPGKFDLLLVDFVVPGMDKKGFFKTLKESQSNLKIIVFSNFYPRGEVATILEENLMGVLDKPVRMRELAAAVSKALSPSN